MHLNKCVNSIVTSIGSIGSVFAGYQFFQLKKKPKNRSASSKKFDGKIFLLIFILGEKSCIAAAQDVNCAHFNFQLS